MNNALPTLGRTVRSCSEKYRETRSKEEVSGPGGLEWVQVSLALRTAPEVQNEVLNQEAEGFL